MRELKFRAWDDGELLEDVTPVANGDNNAFPNLAIVVFEANGETDGIRQVDVIEQYTELKDKNGKEIYEGDIVESTWNGDRAVVVWNDNEGEWGHYADFNTHSKYSGSVVIGNIHENQDLLGDINVTNKEEE